MTLVAILRAAHDALIARAKVLAADRNAMGAIRLLNLAHEIRRAVNLEGAA